MSSIANKIRRRVVKTLSTYQMIADGDTLLVAVSGGMDSSVLLQTLVEIQKKAKINFSVSAVFVDQKFPKLAIAPYQSWLSRQGIKLTVVEFDTYSLIKQKTISGKSPCAICSRLRRGILYTYARNHGFSKIALGHNRDDLNETLLMNMFFSGRISGMPPKIKADKGQIIIRPLCNVPKSLVTERAQELGIPVVSSDFCEEKKDNSRQLVRKLLQDLEQHNSKISENLLASQKNVNLPYLLDTSQWHYT